MSCNCQDCDCKDGNCRGVGSAFMDFVLLSTLRCLGFFKKMRSFGRG